MKKVLAALVTLWATMMVAQTALTTTTLSTAAPVYNPSAAQTSFVTLASTSGITSLSPNCLGFGGPVCRPTVQVLLYADQEAMLVTELDLNNLVKVQRAYNGTKSGGHNAGVTVTIGLTNQFVSVDPTGSCSAASFSFTPVINVLTGTSWVCTSGSWVATLYGVTSGNPGLNTLGPSFNVAVNYGCKPDGSTDNSTCITNAFAASNAITSGGVPTVYFPCVPGTGCQYNINAGSGLSPLNPVIPTAIKCDPEVTLNFTSGSTAHAADIGPTTTNSISAAEALANKGYSILYCRFTGGANITEGIFINQYTPKVEIRGNTFFNFGNASSYSIWCQAECWWLNVQTNYEWVDDGVAHNFLQTNNATATINDESYIANNLNVCTSGTSVVNCGVGYNLDGFFTLYSNDLAGHVPAVRVKAHTNGCHIFENVIEIDVPAAGSKSAIESNNGGSDTQCEIAGNNLYTGAATDALVGVTSGSDVVTLWNVHDNWIRLDSAAQGLVFSLNNLAGQTTKIISRNNARFGGLTNAGSNLTAVRSDDEGTNPFLLGAANIQLAPLSSASANSTLQMYNQFVGATVGWSLGLNIPTTLSATSDLHFSLFNGAWTDEWKFLGTGGHLASFGTAEVIPPVNAVGSLAACSATTEGAHAVANNCNAACTVGGTCTAGATTHCELYCNGSAYLETGR